MSTSPLHPRVTWTAVSDAHEVLPPAARFGRAINTDRIVAWLMILLLAGCVAVAIYDLYLLLITL